MKRIITAIACTLPLLAACGGSSDPGPSQSTATSTAESATAPEDELCPSAESTEEIVTFFSLPVASRDDLSAAAFAMTFTNALGEVVEYVEEDADARPCTGFDELYDTVEHWSDLAIEITEGDEAAAASDTELQEIADLGNEWLEAIDRQDLKFSLDPSAQDIGN